MTRRREELHRAVAVGADRAYDPAAFVRTRKAFGVKAHVARNAAGRRLNIGEEEAASAGYRMNQVHRKRIEETLGWVKTVARLSKIRHRRLALVDGSSLSRWQPTI